MTPLRAALMAASLLLAGAARADGRPPLEDLSLAELLDIRTEVATRTSLPLREVPGVVTVIPREEILALGARDLVDVLQGVPGLHFGMDNENFLGIGVRGIWGQEGKVLLLLDGQVMNDPFYDCLGLGNHYPVDQLERVEVIRGPGSVVYGGGAELAVINLVTRGPGSIGGEYVSAAWGQWAGGWGRRTVSAQVARSVLGERLKFAASAFVGQGHRGSGTFRDYEGGSFDMREGASTDPLLLNLSAQYDQASLRVIYDGYQVGGRDGVGTVVPPVTVGARGLWVELKDRIPLHEAVAVTLSLQLGRQYPWQVTDPESPMYMDGHGDRASAGATLEWRPLRRLEVVAGAEGAVHHGHATNLSGGEGLAVSQDDGHFQTGAGFAEVHYEGAPFHLSAGARYEYHSRVPGSFVPRVALTRVLGPAHLKLLFAHAYRTPGYGNLVLSGGTIRPERTQVAEAEVGWKVDDHLYVVANGYDLEVRSPIVFTSDPVTFVDEYRNGPRLGSRGVEVSAQARWARTSWRLGYSFYTVRGKSSVDIYAVPGHPALARAFPQHKLTVSGMIDLGPVRLGPSFLLTSDRHAERSGDGAGGGVVGNDGPLRLVSLQATWRRLLGSGFDLGLGLHNLFDARNSHLHPYTNHAPMPGAPREVALVLTWQDPM